MAAHRPTGGDLDSLTRRHGIKVVSAVGSIEECSLAVGNVVGHKCVLAASKMNNAIVIFLSTIEKANEVVEKGIEMRGSFVPVLPLSTPAKKVTLSNVPPFIKDEALARELSRFGKLVSPVKKIAIGSKSELLKHVVSFRRFTYMILNNGNELDLNLKFRIDDFDYTIFVSTDTMRCFGCGKTGHQIRACPDNSANVSKPGSSGAQHKAVNSGNADESNPTDVGLDEGSAVEMKEKTVTEEHGVEQVEPDKHESVNENSEKLKSVSASQTLDVDSASENTNTKNGGLLMEVDQSIFKTPLKRKKKKECTANKQARKLREQTSENDQGTESECDSSDSSASFCSQTDWPCHNCSTEKNKTFLKVTKNLRGVQIVDYFPNLKRFVEVTKSSMTEGRFLDKEVYRLKKIVTKVQNQLNNSENENEFNDGNLSPTQFFMANLILYYGRNPHCFFKCEWSKGCEEEIGNI